MLVHVNRQPAKTGPGFCIFLDYSGLYLLKWFRIVLTFYWSKFNIINNQQPAKIICRCSGYNPVSLFPVIAGVWYFVTAGKSNNIVFLYE